MIITSFYYYDVKQLKRMPIHMLLWKQSGRRLACGIFFLTDDYSDAWPGNEFKQ